MDLRIRTVTPPTLRKTGTREPFKQVTVTMMFILEAVFFKEILSPQYIFKKVKR